MIILPFFNPLNGNLERLGQDAVRASERREVNGIKAFLRQTDGANFAGFQNLTGIHLYYCKITSCLGNF